PLRLTSRRSNSRSWSGSKAAASMPISANSSSTGEPGGTANAACTVAASAPVRTASRLARFPKARPRASMTMDLPAPVSPVSAHRPGVSSKSRDSMSAKLRICRCTSMLPLPLAPAGVTPGSRWRYPWLLLPLPLAQFPEPLEQFRDGAPGRLFVPALPFFRGHHENGVVARQGGQGLGPPEGVHGRGHRVGCPGKGADDDQIAAGGEARHVVGKGPAGPFQGLTGSPARPRRRHPAVAAVG